MPSCVGALRASNFLRASNIYWFEIADVKSLLFIFPISLLIWNTSFYRDITIYCKSCLEVLLYHFYNIWLISMQDTSSLIFHILIFLLLIVAKVWKYLLLLSLSYFNTLRRPHMSPHPSWFLYFKSNFMFSFNQTMIY